MKKRYLIILIPVIAVLANGVAYLVVRKGRTPAEKVDPQPMAKSSTAPTPEVAPVAAPPPVARANERAEMARARRAAGLADLERGEYDKALANFVAAKENGNDDAHVEELIRVTEELLKNSGKTRPHLQLARAEVSRPAPRTAAARHTASREPAPSVETAEAPAPTPATGTLIVTSTPRGLLVRVDDNPMDLTPMRSAISPGSHRVALLDGDRKVYETTVAVREAEVSTLSKDLSSELAPPSPSGATPHALASKAPSPAVPPPAAPEKPSATAPLPTSTASLSPTESPAAGSSSVPNTGSLAVSSPGLYGVVWINGRPRGYPPLEVTDLPVGPAKVEVRVNGIEKRSSTVLVERERRVPVTLRSDDTAR